MSKYILTMFVEHRGNDGCVIRRSNHRRLTVDGINTHALTEYQAKHSSQCIGFEYHLENKP